MRRHVVNNLHASKSESMRAKRALSAVQSRDALERSLSSLFTASSLGKIAIKGSRACLRNQPKPKQSKREKRENHQENPVPFPVLAANTAVKRRSPHVKCQRARCERECLYVSFFKQRRDRLCALHARAGPA